MKLSKRMKEAHKVIGTIASPLSLQEAVNRLAKAPKVKFDETVELHFNLNLDLKASDQGVRGTVVLPHGIGKKVRVAAFCKGDAATKAQAAGADYVGDNDLIEKVIAGFMDFDVVVASPDMMRDLSKLGKVLGPKGLMPNPKTGTVTVDVAKAVQEVKAGKVEFRTDKTALVHVPVGKISFSPDKLIDNATVLITSVIKAKPSVAKGKYIKGCTLSSTMGPGILLDTAPIETAAKA